MITQKDLRECNAVLNELDSILGTPAVPLPSIQQQIDAQRELCYASDKAIHRLETELEFENARSVLRHDALSALLNLQDLANSPRLNAGEHNAYPAGRGAAI